MLQASVDFYPESTIPKLKRPRFILVEEALVCVFVSSFCVQHRYNRGKSVRSWCDGSSDRSFLVDPLSYFRSSQCSMAGVTKAVVCAMGLVHIKE